jgi:cytochrome c5
VLKPLLLLSALLLFETNPVSSPDSAASPEPAWLQQDAAAAPATPPDTKNPVTATPESQAKAKKMWGYDCEMCHGATGNGKTDLANDMKLSLTDLSDPKTLDGKTDAELFDLIKNGKGKMPPEDAARAKPNDIWNLVIYTRSLAKK